MKNKIFMRMFTVLFAAIIMISGVSITAYAGGGPEDEEPPVSTVEETEQPEETTGGYEPVPLTPEGNMTLVDDIEGETSGDKQFITVVTRNGNYFYIIIDRAEDGENTVHFLNQVDEADLLALMEDGAVSTPAPIVSCLCTDKCEAGSVNTNCPVCKNDMTNCMGTATTPDPDPVPEQSGGLGGILAVLFILALGGGGAFYYFKVLKPKQSVKGGSIDDFDFEDDEDEDEEYETEMLDLEQEDEQEDSE